MNKKKIVDYIVVDGEIPETNIFERIESKIIDLKEKINSNNRNIELYSIKYERYKFLNKEFGKFKQLKKGVEYKPLTKEESWDWNKKANLDEFPNIEYDFRKPRQNKFKHPFDVSQVRGGKIIFGNGFHGGDPKKLEIDGAYRLICDEYYKVSKIVETAKYENIHLEKELSKLTEDVNPLTNTTLRTDFENHIIELSENGYEVVGGIDVKYGKCYQAMAKFE